ncbi:phage distal tail protein [Actinomadura opuntiae]|uniref:phage distal tail protein n=1 Tax=Actinomadura sp. OS1-43 TaxID=604315 RepID=UPI00255A8947|nr:phage tail domain-containing protein [Actinomadura sp. OS1-43]MDL4812822.1 phage tail family protein [Actinomadura sp. OS1-43]
MPILVPVSAPPVVTPPSVPQPAVTTIVDPAGRAWPLDGSSGIHRQPGRKGFHAPTYVHYRDESPMVDGAFWRGVRASVRELFIPIVIIGQTRAELLATRRALIASISPRRGECTIVSAQPDGTRRMIGARYVSGMEGEEGKGPWGVLLMSYGLTFVADAPYFYSDPIPLEWGSGDVTRTELPIPGDDGAYEVVSASQILGSSSVVNPGDVDAYPVWEFNGPFTEIALTNLTSGKSMTLTHTAGTPADTLTIDTTPGQTAVVDQAGANQWDSLSAGYSLWPLVPLQNDLSIEVSGSTTLTGARMTYRPRYESD